jgi:hypothetical protein
MAYVDNTEKMKHEKESRDYFLEPDTLEVDKCTTR